MTDLFGYTLWGDAGTEEEATTKAKMLKAEGNKVMLQAIKEFGSSEEARYWAIWVKPSTSPARGN